MGIATQEELLRQHEKDLLKLKNRPQARQIPGTPMTASAVAGVGAAVAGPGIIEFTLASGSIDIDGIFTTDFEDYKMYLDIYGSTANTGFAAQLRNAGGVYGAVAYRAGQFTMAYAGSTSYASAVASTQWPYFGASSGSGGGSSEITMFSPARANAEVKATGETISSGGRTSWWAWCGSGVGSATGLRLGIPTGQITGRLRVYGINAN